MKVKESHWREAAKADKNDRPDWAARNANRQRSAEEATNAAHKSRQTDSPQKDEAKFANLLESPAKLQKPKQNQDDASEQRRDDHEKDKKHVSAEKESTELTAGSDGKADKYDSTGGQSGGGGAGGQSGFGANVGQLNLSENFAARSILHIADLERLVSTVRTQINLGGRREIILQLKRSVLEGLQVKITTDPAASVQIEFLAAGEAVRSQIASHTHELADILRGRGINISSLTTSLGDGSDSQNRNSADGVGDVLNSTDSARNNDLSGENTFDAPLTSSITDGKIYQA